MEILKQQFTKCKFIFVVLLFAILSVFNLFHAGLPPTHDGEYHVVRFYEFDKTLRDGNWYPLWAPDLIYTFGSPLFNYVYPFPNYVASTLHLFRLSYIDSFKLNLILASLAGAVGAYLFGRNRFGSWGGLLTSAFYTFAPYHSLDVYVRGSVGEVWALAFFPLSLWLLDRISKRPNIVNASYAGIFFALIIFSHNILAVMFSIFSLSYALLLVFESKKKIRTSMYLISSFILGTSIPSVFILPALLEQKYVIGLKVFDVFSNFPEIYQLIIPSWGSGYSGVLSGSQMSFQIGLANLFLIILVLAAIFSKNAKKDRVFPVFFLVWFFAFCFLITPFSIYIWRAIPQIQYFQFPWRFLSIVILCCSVLAGYITLLYKSKILYFFLLVFLILTTFSYARAPYFMDRDDKYYLTHDNFIHGSNSVADVFQTIWLPQQTELPKQRAYLKGMGTFSLKHENSSTQLYSVNLAKPSELTINTAYFPGWKAYVNKREIPLIEKEGKISISLPRGKYYVDLKLTETPIRLVSKIVSITAAAAVVLILFKASYDTIFS